VLYDDCHFNVSGCEKVAGILHDFLLTKMREQRRTINASADEGIRVADSRTATNRLGVSHDAHE
jgi:hypothetical protein